jgi:hypothetical protein
MSHFSISIQCSSAYGVRSTNTTETNDGGNGDLESHRARTALWHAVAVHLANRCQFLALVRK